MPSTTVNVGYRPVRIALLVREGSLDDVAWAAQANSYVWGGIHNPIVPVGRSVSKALAQLDEFRADVVAVAGRQEPTATQAKVITAFRETRPLPPSSREPFEFMTMGALPFVDVRLICKHYHEIPSSPQDRAFTLVDWADEDPLHSVLFGRFWNDEIGDRYRGIFDLGLRANTITVEKAMNEGYVVSPLFVTGTDLLPLMSDPHTYDPYVVVGDPSDPAVLLTFWNLRSIGRLAILWPSVEHPGLEKQGAAWLKLISERRKRHPDGVPIGVVSIGDVTVPRPLVEVLEHVGLQANLQPHTRVDWTDPLFRPAVWTNSQTKVLATLEPGRRSPQAPKLVIGLPPRPFERGSSEGLGFPAWLVNVQTFRGPEFEDYTFELPPVPAMTPWAIENVARYGGVRLQDEGIGVFARVADISVEIGLVREDDVVRETLKSAGITATVSPAGEATAQIIRQMGGLMGSRVLRLQGLRDMLFEGDWHTHRVALQLLQAKGAFKRFHVRRDPTELMRDLVDRGVLQPALHVACPECRVTTPYRPDDLHARLTCPRCASDFALAPLIQASPWKYRASGFFEMTKTHGSIPVVLSMLALSEVFGYPYPTIATSHDLVAQGVEAEVDFVALWRAQNGQPVMAIAECKGGPQEITAEETEKLMAVAERIRGAGIECYVVLATTRGEFTTDELAHIGPMIDEMAKSDLIDPDALHRPRQPVLLTADLLDCFQSWRIPREPAFPVPHPSSVADLAENSVAMHFGDPPPGRLDRRHSNLLI